MKVFFICVFLCSLIKSSGQGKVDTSCACSFSVSANYPKNMIGSNLSRTVIVEIQQDTNCYLSNPTIIDSVGDDFEKEALKTAKIIIDGQNRCNQKCKIRICPVVGLKQVFTFVSPEE